MFCTVVCWSSRLRVKHTNRLSCKASNTLGVELAIWWWCLDSPSHLDVLDSHRRTINTRLFPQWSAAGSPTRSHLVYILQFLSFYFGIFIFNKLHLEWNTFYLQDLHVLTFVGWLSIFNKATSPLAFWFEFWLIVSYNKSGYWWNIRAWVTYCT